MNDSRFFWEAKMAFCVSWFQPVHTTVWRSQPKVVQTVQQHCLIWIYLDT